MWEKEPANASADSRAEGEKEKSAVCSICDLITATERHCKNIKSFADRKLFDRIKEASDEMGKLLQELREAVYMGNHCSGGK